MIKKKRKKGVSVVDTVLINEKYRKISVASLATGILAASFCIVYFLAWMFFDNFIERIISQSGFISIIMLLFVSAGVVLTITALITGSIDLNRIKAGMFSRKGKGFDIGGITLSSLLVLFGFILWLLDFFNILEIIS